MKNVILVLMCALTVACAKGHDRKLEVSGFEEQVSAFERGAASIGINYKVDDLVIVFTTNLSSAGRDDDGLCVTNKDATPIIYVDKSRWDRKTDRSKELLILHEMGHCVLFRMQHNATKVSVPGPVGPRDVPQSVMTPYNTDFDGFAGDYYDDHKPQYFYELFYNR